VSGYHSALENPKLGHLVPQLDQAPLELRGFAYEGAAMGLALLDLITPWNRGRISAFLAGAGDSHAYMVHVGAGWLLARMPVNVEKIRRRFDPLLGWLLIDGYGFHEGFFHWPNYIDGQPPPQRLTGYAPRVFDQGLGRSLWFVNGTDSDLIAATIRTFSQERRGDLWSGVGLACGYAGGMGDDTALCQLRAAAGAFQPQLAQGSAFAAKARQRAGNITGHTRMACDILCGLTAEQAAAVTDAALENLPATEAEPAYEIWRRRIQERFMSRKEMKK